MALNTATHSLTLCGVSIGFGAVRVLTHFKLLVPGSVRFFGKTLILILFVLAAGFGFFHISVYSLVYSESWSLKDSHRHIKMPKKILNLT